MQKKAVAIIQKQIDENRRVSVSAAMREAGYNHQVATAPAKLTDSKGFQELFGNRISDDFLIKKHRALLNKKDPNNPDEPETQAVSRSLDMAYKVKGYYESEKSTPAVQVYIGGLEKIIGLAFALREQGKHRDTGDHPSIGQAVG